MGREAVEVAGLRVARQPRAKQRIVMEMLDGVLQQTGR